MRIMAEPRAILITGASSGIGAALARCYAAPGIRLILGGRDAERLESTAAPCRAAGAEVAVASIDVADGPEMARWIEGTDAESPLDLAIANAGVAYAGGHRNETRAIAAGIIATNVGGVVNTVYPAIARMRPRGRGQIAIVSSLAGFRGYPGAAAYCASKASVRSLGEALRAELAASGVNVSVVCPGFVATPMTDGSRFPMPFLLDADRAARLIRRGLAANRGRIAFPLPLYLGTLLFAALPDGVANYLVTRRR
jgi:short-subunit dehydrogenase